MSRFFVATRYLIILPVIGLGLAAAVFFVVGALVCCACCSRE